MQQSHRSTKCASVNFTPGQPFNSHGMFTGVFIPDFVMRSQLLSPGAKLVWGRLQRYMGKDGECYPSMQSIGDEIGLSERQVRRYIAEMERDGFLKRIVRTRANGSQTSNGFALIWHISFESPIKQGRTDVTAHPRTDVTAPEESHNEERKTRTARLPSSGGDNPLPPSRPKQYPDLKKLIADYMSMGQDVRVEPSDDTVAMVMHVAGGASETDVMRCLVFMHNERGLRRGTINGPHHWAWFVSVVEDFFAKKTAREGSRTPSGYHEWLGRNYTRGVA